jgi:TolA-binding protein
LFASAEYWLAEASFRLGQYSEAEERLKGLSDSAANKPAGWLAMVELRKAQVLARKKQWLDAYTLAMQIAERFPDFERQHEADYTVGRCLASMGRFREAREAYQRVVDSDRGRNTELAAMAQWMIGETYFHQRNYVEAERAYLRVELLWDYPRWTAAALLQVAKCSEFQQRWEQAVERYEELTTRFADSRFAEEGRKRLIAARQRVAHQAADAASEP